MRGKFLGIEQSLRYFIHKGGESGQSVEEFAASALESAKVFSNRISRNARVRKHA